jgi:flavin reductase (DIM6/NTAB) family NADH-FMN oxidoreductase RutF
METAHDHITITPKILYFGTPVVLLSTENDDGSPNLAPMSSVWALGEVFVLGLGSDGQTATNLRRRPQLVINFPAPENYPAIERLALLTGAHPVPEDKRPRFRHESDKFRAAGLSAQPSELVRPPRVAECPVQIEASVSKIDLDSSDDFFIVEARCLRVHADPRIVIEGTSHIDPTVWSPLVYNFRHYFRLGNRLGKSIRAEY